ncbi:MAG: glycerophosphodiester phosphodiesterase [Pyrinomonadaceae bacterium]
MQVIGHRGAAALAPENTFESFDAALAVGADAIETDVQETEDGELILIHDKTLDRTTNGKGEVRSTSWRIIQTLDAGSWFGEKYRGAKVPLLSDALRRYGRRTQLVLEIKRTKSALKVLQLVRDLDLIERVTFTSFKLAVVRKVKARHPAAKVGFLASNVGDTDVKAALAAGMDQFCPAACKVSPLLVAQWKALGLEVRAWGVKDIELMHSAIQAKVDGMTVDSPDLLLQALGRHGTGK